MPQLVSDLLRVGTRTLPCPWLYTVVGGVLTSVGPVNMDGATTPLVIPLRIRVLYWDGVSLLQHASAGLHYIDVGAPSEFPAAPPTLL